MTILISAIPATLCALGILMHFLVGVVAVPTYVGVAELRYEQVKNRSSKLDRDKIQEWFRVNLKRERALEELSASLKGVVRASGNLLLFLSVIALWVGFRVAKQARTETTSNEPLNPASDSVAALREKHSGGPG